MGKAHLGCVWNLKICLIIKKSNRQFTKWKELEEKREIEGNEENKISLGQRTM
jgi:hypothetical protein